MDQTPNLALPYILPAQAQKHVTHNESLKVIDAILQMAVLDRNLSDPPATPSDGERYVVAASPTGAWTGHANAIAAFQDAAWNFYTPAEGWMTWVSDEDLAIVWNGSAWVALPIGSGGAAQFTELGVNATADATNKLAVSSEAVLINHAGAGTQVKLNKSAAPNSASFLFQTAFSGRAEIGTTGDDSFHFKVSPDGATWKDAIIIDKTSGAVSMPFTSGGSGSVTNVATGTGLTGGPIVTSGTISMANMAAQSLKGNSSAATAPPADLTGTQATALLDVVTSSSKGLAPASGGGNTNFLRADGTWSAPPGGGEANTATNVGTAGVGVFKQKTGVNLEFKKINAASSKIAITDDTANSELDIDVVESNLTLANLAGSIDLGGAKASGTLAATRMPAHTGDVTSVAGSLALTIADGAVSNVKAADMPANTLKGNNTGGTAVPADLTGPQATAMLVAFTGDSGTGGTKGLVPGPAAGDAAANKFLNASGAWAVPPGAGGGETNTASNVGTAGVGLFKQKSGVNLEFKKINAGSSKITVVDDEGNNEVDIDVSETNLSVFGSSAKGVVPASGGGTANFLRADGTWAAPPTGAPTIVTLSADVSNSTTTLQSVGDFSGQTLDASSRYLVEILGSYQTAAITSGIAMSIEGSAGSTTVIGQLLTNISATTYGGTELTANGATSGASSGVRAANTPTGLYLWAIIVTPGTAGTLTTKFRSEVGGTNATLLAATTTMRLTKLL